MNRLRSALFACALTSAMGVLAGPAITATGPYQPFISTSYWRTPSSAPADAKSGAMVSWLSSVLKSDRRFVTIRATNLNSSSAQGTSVYYGASTDPAFKICHNPNYKTYSWTTDFDSVRIPSGARAPTDNDADMLVYNTYQGKLFWFTNMQMISGRWCASQASVYYVGSNGLHGKLPQSDNVKNWGKHGLAPVTLYTGTMCTTSASNSIPAGAVLRIKPSIDLSQYPLNPSARIIARGLQQFGAVVGDRSGVGNNATIKLEDTVVEGKGNLWANAGLAFDSLKSIPISAYQVDKLGAGR
jgi:hypothetical protein